MRARPRLGIRELVRVFGRAVRGHDGQGDRLTPFSHSHIGRFLSAAAVLKKRYLLYNVLLKGVDHTGYGGGLVESDLIFFIGKKSLSSIPTSSRSAPAQSQAKRRRKGHHRGESIIEINTETTHGKSCRQPSDNSSLDPAATPDMSDCTMPATRPESSSARSCPWRAGSYAACRRRR